MRKKTGKVFFSVSSSTSSFSFFFLCVGIFFCMEMAMAQNRKTVPINVGVVMDMDEGVGKMVLSCISMALSDFYSSDHGSDYKTRLILHTRDSKRDVVAAAAAALDLLKNVEVEAIIGPTSSMQADFIIGLGEKSQVPIISFSATSPSLSSYRNPYFIRATQNDSSQVNTISSIIQSFGWREVVPIYVDNQFGEGIIPFLADALEKINARIPYRSVIPEFATDDHIKYELSKLMSMQTRVFVVHMTTSLGTKLFTKAKELGMMSEGYVWIITDAMANQLNSMDSSVIESMQGVIGVKPYVPRTKQLENFTTRWKLKFQQENPTILNAQLNVFGLWAYDSAIVLATAVEKSRITGAPFQKPNISGNATELEAFGVSKDGPKLLQAILNTTFKGLSGDFQIVDGQLQSPAYQIINVFGNGAKGIGFWTRENGIVKELNLRNTNNVYSISKAIFGTIIWPGDTTSVPRGWVIPTNGKKLRIGVPVKDGFSEFVKVTRDFTTNTTTVTGYCIDVFDAVMAALSYYVPYEYVPFAAPGKATESYDDLIYQVFLGTFDAVAGDTTIVSNRSQYVDFTLPYTESGVTMMVPIKDDNGDSAWVFLKPLTRELWLTSFCSFVFIGFVIWLLEHRVNEDFRGPPSHQVGMIFWFAFSTMVFAQKEKIVSNLARFVLVIWFLVVLILTSSYTASLTSMLTVEKLQPTVRDIKELQKNKEYVGYLQGSFVPGLLKKMNFDEDRLKEYSSPEECVDLLSKGSASGGVAAVFDEIPYVKLVLANHCSKFTTVGPTYKADGFGFVFPMGSPLVPDVSRAVLSVTESEKMVQIEKAWFGESTCSDSSTSLSSNSLGLASFWGLFVIAAVAAILALLIFLTKFMHEYWHIIKRTNLSFRERVRILARKFDRKDYSCHTFKKSELRDAMRDSARMDCSQSPHDNLSMLSSPRTNGPPSPSISSYTEQSFHFPGEVGTPPLHEENVAVSTQESVIELAVDLSAGH
ncbi:PREDICTED: glutamate receptor 2.7-like [Nicotiana attenuata]|uniref:Glutamate receptor n=1 Tax=Nicotiana attenuata TaxID=49451 RepID=A0A314KIX7_NICAT|nr:PREDICTED: glutamate receptor 2.7-like [Nicotiana attenuata]OIT29132.1 glutamate receptor 2.7 [Nicotiana attenuata]